ncbi:hypothetical protein D5S17_11580 [Pseudonocardiaceae bacterium YIM PH 21723]|nr:hypothetical protein D5S17_11580 [Pseudonocardiaceae bacterium YIM PH 21723]
MELTRERHINQALLRIPRRAESVDRHTLATTFVSSGSLSAMLHSTDHQILYGRRGTGKTHALLHLSDQIEQMGDVPVYLDLRTIGSAGGLYADNSLSRAHRGTQLLVDTLEAIHEELLSTAINKEVSDQDGLLRGLDSLATASTGVEVIGAVEHESTVAAELENTNYQENSAEIGGFFGPGAGVTAGSEQKVTQAAEGRVRRIGVERHHVVFGPLSRSLRQITGALGRSRVWLLLDEWSSIPLDLQPFLADLIRRSVLPTAGMTVKIAAIERRSKFLQPCDNGDYLGIEVGADAASAMSLDDLMIFDHSRNRSVDFFERLFHNHASSVLPTDLHFDEPKQFITSAFKRQAFAELVRAAEGVPRDAINIAALAAQQAHEGPISILDVRTAARDWYLRDKQGAISANKPARKLLRLLVDEVVGHRKARTFLIEQGTSVDNELVQELYDARLLHVLRRGIVDHRNPGTYYDGLAIDYGCYVALLIDGNVKISQLGKDLWLNAARGVPLEDFDLQRPAIDIGTLRG